MTKRYRRRVRVLVVDDDAELIHSVARGLRDGGFVLDRMLPDGDSLPELARRRAAGCRVPTLFLTARDAIDDRVDGFGAGADDYLVKPFALAELVARVRALSRRGEAVVPPVLRCGDLELDLARRQVRRDGVLFPLARKEMAVLEILLSRAGTVVARSDLVESCWDEMSEPMSNVVDVLVLDDTNRSRVEEDEALRRLTVAMATMYTEDDTELHLEELRTDDVTVGHPEVYVMPPRGDRPLLVGTDRSLDVPVRSLRALADRVTPGDEDVRLEGRDTRGRPVVLVGRPYEEDDELLAVGIVVVDPQAGAAGHRRLRWAVGAGVLVLECGVALAGHALAGRMLRPVVANLDAHEAFLADAAHELRAPVAAIRAAAGRGDTERVVRQAARLGDTVEALLTRSRLAAGVQVVRRTPVRLDLLVEEVVADRTGEAAGGVDDVVVEAGPTVVEADPALVAIAVRNLIDNGLRHGHRPEEPARVTVRVDGPRVTVIDRGPGVPPSLEGDRFDRYVTSGGAGLGLSIAAAVAAGHGGCLRVDAADGGGAAFVLTLAS